MILTVHIDAQTIRVAVTLVTLASAAGTFNDDSTQEMLNRYANSLRVTQKNAILRLLVTFVVEV